MSEKLLELVKEGESEEVEFKNKRVGTENIIISPEELERIILEKRKRYWDSEICEEGSLEDIDEEKVKWFLKVAKVGRDYPLDENISVRDALTHSELLKEGKLTNVAVVLFGKNPQKFFLQSEVKCLHLIWLIKRFSLHLEPVRELLDMNSNYAKITQKLRKKMSKMNGRKQAIVLTMEMQVELLLMDERGQASPGCVARHSGLPHP